MWYAQSTLSPDILRKVIHGFWEEESMELLRSDKAVVHWVRVRAV